MAHYPGAQPPQGYTSPLGQSLPHPPDDDTPLDFSLKSTNQPSLTESNQSQGSKRPQYQDAEEIYRIMKQHVLSPYGKDSRSYPGFNKRHERMVAFKAELQAAVPVSDHPHLKSILARLRVKHLTTESTNNEIASYRNITSNGSISPPEAEIGDMPRLPGIPTFNGDHQTETIPLHVQANRSIPHLMSIMNPLVNQSLLAHRLRGRSPADLNGDNKGGKHVRPFKAYTNQLLMNPYISMLDQQLMNNSTNHRPSSSYVPSSKQTRASNREDTSCTAHYDNPDFSVHVNSPAESCSPVMASGDNGYGDQRCRSPNPLVDIPTCDSNGILKSCIRATPTNGDSNGSEDVSGREQSPPDTSNGTFRRKGRSLPEELKDEAYWERRRKNNQAAKRSRDQRRKKEDLMALQATALSEQNFQQNVSIEILKREINELRQEILFYKEKLNWSESMKESFLKILREHGWQLSSDEAFR